MKVWTRISLVSRPGMFSVPTVEHVRNVPHFEAIAKRRTLSIAQRLIQDDGRGRAIFYGNERIGKQRTVTPI